MSETLTSGLAWPAAIALAWLAGELGQRWLSLPRISSYGLAGFFMAAHQGGFLPSPAGGPIQLLADLAFALMLFELGYRINLRWLRTNPWIAATSLLEAGATFAAVFLVAQAFAVPLIPSLLLAALAMSTSPAAVLRVANELRSSGQVTERLLHLSAANCVLALLVFKLILAYALVAGAGDLLTATWHSVVQVAVSAGIGVLFGVAVPGLLRSLGHVDRQATLAFAVAVLLLTALTSTLKFSPLLAALAFALTGAQQRAWGEIAADLAQPHPMQRLLQGDVGSGKTIVAALAMLQAVEAGHQAALMAPTEILAEQHYRKLAAWLAPLGLEVAWLAGSLKKSRKAAMAAALADGSIRLAVGTHALIEETVDFARLGLAIVDEQHRFGVQQRLSLKQKGESAHQLTMSATPIPRTLAMSYYADLDVSVLDELPPGRRPVVTKLVAEGRRDQVTGLVRDACRAGRQAYWVCPLIEESEKLQLQTVVDTFERLRAANPSPTTELVYRTPYELLVAVDHDLRVPGRGVSDERCN